MLGQFEQLSNVAALELLAAADSMMTLEPQTVKRWLKRGSPEPINYPDVGDLLVPWLLAGNWQDSQSLCRELWQQVTLPDTWFSKQDARALSGLPLGSLIR